MIEILLTVIPSVCWMVFRCYQLLHTPAERLARQLNVDIPHTPCVCVDQLGSSHVVLHWDIEMTLDENIFYVVLVNGKDAGTLAQTSVKLCNLEPDSLYRVQVLAVNAISNFRSQSPAVYVHTQKTGNERATAEKVPFLVARRVELPTLCHDSPPTNYSLDLSPGEVANVTDKAVLAEYLYVFHNEVSRVTKDIDALLDHQKQEETRLKAELESYRKELDEGSDMRARKDLDVKGLEKKKDLLTFEKLKVTKQLKNYESLRTLHMNNIAELKAKASKLREKRQHVINLSKTEKSKVNVEMNAINGDICHIREDISSLEQSVKELSNERKELSQMLQNLRPLVHQFVTPPIIANGSETPEGSTASLVAAAEIFTRESSLTKLGIEVLRKIYSYKPTWEVDLEKEIDALSSLENTWKNTFRGAVRRFVLLQNAVEVSRASQDESYEPQKISEYQASVEFGGFGNAIVKSSARRKGYYFVDEGSASPSPPPEANDKWRNNYSQIYDENADSLSAPSATVLSSANVLSSVNNVNSVGVLDSVVNLNALNSVDVLNSAIALELARYPMLKQYSGSPGGMYNDTENSYLENAYQKPYIGQYEQTYANNVAEQTAGNNYAENSLGNYSERPYVDTAYPEQSYPDSYAEQPQAYDQAYLDRNYGDQSYGDRSYGDRSYGDQNYGDQNYGDNAYMDSNLMGHAMAYTDSTTYPMLSQPLANPGLPANYLRPEIDQPLQPQTLINLSITQPMPQSIPQSSMQQYAQNIRQSFPYDDVYNMRSPTPDSYMHQVQPNLWNSLGQNLSNSNFLESRQAFSGLPLLPSSANMELHPSQSHSIAGSTGAAISVPQVAVSQDSNLLNSLLLSSSTSQIGQASIWLDKPMTSSYSHNRAVSSTSQLWRNDARMEGSPNLALGSEFLPFARDNDSIQTSPQE